MIEISLKCDNNDGDNDLIDSLDKELNKMKRVMRPLKMKPVVKRNKSQKLPNVRTETLEEQAVEVYFRFEEIEPVGMPFEESKDER